MRNDKLAELARRQNGVFARWQARDLGISYGTIARRLESGEWRAVIGSVLTAGTSQLNAQGMLWAGYLAAGRGAVLSGPSAVARHGIEVPHRSVWVTVPAERNVRVRGVRTIREALPPADVLTMSSMRVTTLSRSIIDCLRVLPIKDGQPLLDRALLRGWLTLDELADRVERFGRRRGIVKMRTHLKRVWEGARSEAERIAHAILRDAGISGWTANYEVTDAVGTIVAVLDLAFEREKLAVEIDGLAFHAEPDRFQGDRSRQNYLIQYGWTVLRFTWDDLKERPSYVIATILATLARLNALDR